MSVTPTLVTGDDSLLPTELFKDDIAFLINSSAVVKASVVSKDRKTIILDPVIVSISETGSDWVNSLVVPKFASADTGAILSNQLGSALLEIQVDETVSGGGKQTWFATIKILQGTIDQ